MTLLRHSDSQNDLVEVTGTCDGLWDSIKHPTFSSVLNARPLTPAAQSTGTDSSHLLRFYHEPWIEMVSSNSTQQVPSPPLTDRETEAQGVSEDSHPGPGMEAAAAMPAAAHHLDT